MFDLALHTDFYQLTMANGYFLAGMHTRKAVFHHFFRRPPFGGGYSIACGLEKLIAYIDNFTYTQEDLAYLKNLKNSDGSLLFHPSFLNYLKNFSFQLTLEAMPEGTPCFPYEPLVKVTGPLIACQLLETPLLNLLNFPTLIATKAARIKSVCGEQPVLEFGLRRSQGLNGGLTASRSAYIGGIDATSNLLAAKKYGLPVRGTQAHSWIMSFTSEEEAFERYAEFYPDPCILLVDTYDTTTGIEKAIKIGKQLASRGKNLAGIRLDSGDLAFLSKQARKQLDAAGLQHTKIYVSNELDEYLIQDLKNQGALIDCWGVGTSLVTGKEHSSLDGVYKLSALQNQEGLWEYKIKLSEQYQKISNPGSMQVRRYYQDHLAVCDVIYDAQLGIGSTPYCFDPLDITKKRTIPKGSTFKDLLEPIYIDGKKVYTPPTLQKVRENTLHNLSTLPDEIKRFVNPHQFMVGFETKLHEKKLALIHSLRNPKNQE